MRDIETNRKTVAFSVDGNVYELPLPQSLPVSKSRRIVEISMMPKDQQDNAMYFFLIDLLDEYCAGVTDLIGNDGLVAIFSAWNAKNIEETGESLGE